MAYEMRLNGMLLPVTPEKLQRKVKNQNETVTLIDGSEVNLLKAPGLMEIELEALLPQTMYPFAIYPDGFQPAEYYLDELKRLKDDKKAFTFTVTRESPSGQKLFYTEMEVSLEDYTIAESADNGQDVMVSITLKEYRPYGTKRPPVVSVDPQGVTTISVVESRPAKEPAASYTVKAGDKLWDICKVHLGDGRRYSEIAKLNGISNPNLIFAGQVIRLG
ncbi:LysM peptidoglycan-binding domain-containing protein [Aminipila butyrica]|uniref:LysM peptidoglycan-binding domain-containing protein n=1 Tax=Aminipila butyrica TaxID=433296 RepID=A0A858BTG9_9FIRM|nr:LysM peptidoglycan-binding domain-containing protein [Aminipila butyrica]QIB68642.1 LysM peptidoglycan-binding domain-containing protein [Aminipila butyrica]